MTTRKSKSTEPDTPAMTLEPTAQRTTQEIDAEIATKEAELEALRRERAYVPFPRALYRVAAPPVAQKVPRFQPKAAEPVDVDTVVVYSDEGVAAAEADGYTEDLESIVDPTPPDPEAPIDQSTRDPSAQY